jgi:hypothetical protein
MIYLLLKRALVMRDVLGTTSESQFCAEIISPSVACSTRIARDADFQRNSVTDKISSYAFADSLHRPRRLVAQGQRRAGLEVSIAEMLVVGNVTAANSRASHGDLELSLPGTLQIPLLLLSISISLDRIQDRN